MGTTFQTAGLGTHFGSMADVGINDQLIKEVRSQVAEGTSALFLLNGEWGAVQL